MMRLMKLAVVSVVFMALVGSAYAGKAKGKSSASAESDLVIGVMSLDDAITAVRPAHTVENSQPVFKIQWSPAITLKKETPPDRQLEIAQKVAAFVVDFQGGVLTKGVMGGMLVFIEGETGWTPLYGQVGYKVEKGKVAVWADKNIVEGTSVSCCDEGLMIGTVVGAKMAALPLSPLPEK